MLDAVKFLIRAAENLKFSTSSVVSVFVQRVPKMHEMSTISQHGPYQEDDAQSA